MAQRDSTAPGTIVGSYTIVRELGRGGMGAVYEARHASLPRRVAIKTLLPEHASNAEIAGRFVREAHAAARVDHPNIVKVHDVGLSDGTPFIVMDYLDGESLGARLDREGHLSIETAVEVLVPTMAAISAAHEEGVIHRDLKPDNVFLAFTRDGELHPTVVDFGISRVVTHHDPKVRTASGVWMGTPEYMSPEQARGLREIDDRSDQWALGVILYQCLTGECPFRVAGDRIGVLLRVAQGDYQPLRERQPDLPLGLDAIVTRSLSAEPDHRFPSARAMALALLPFGSLKTRLRWSERLQPDEAPSAADADSAITLPIDPSPSSQSGAASDTIADAPREIDGATRPSTLPPGNLRPRPPPLDHPGRARPAQLRHRLALPRLNPSPRRADLSRPDPTPHHADRVRPCGDRRARPGLRRDGRRFVRRSPADPDSAPRSPSDSGIHRSSAVREAGACWGDDASDSACGSGTDARRDTHRGGASRTPSPAPRQPQWRPPGSPMKPMPLPSTADPIVRRVRPSRAGAFALGALLSWAAPSQAQTANADALVEQGLALRDRGDLDGAARTFQRAWEEGHSPRAEAQLAITEQGMGRWSAADRHLREALGATAHPWIQQNRARLEQALAAIATHLGSVQVRGGVDGAAVLYNGQPLTTLPMTAPARVDVGSGVIEVRAEGYHPWSRPVTVAAGGLFVETATLIPIALARGERLESIGIESSPDEAMPPRVRTEPRASTQRTLAWVVTGLAGAGLALGLTWNGIREGRFADYDSMVCGQPKADAVDVARCQAVADGAAAADPWMWTGYVSAGVFGVTALLLHLTSPAAVEGGGRARLVCGLDAIGRAAGCALAF